MIFQDKKIIWVTGSSGFLGKRLVRHFASEGHNVVGISRRQSEHSVVMDLASDEAVEHLRNIPVPEIVIHAASKQPSQGSLAEFVTANVRTTQKLIDALADRPVKKFIYTSTLSVYHRPASLPVKESAPAGGTLPYSATKRWGEQLLEGLAYTADVTVLRLPSLYGAGQADSFIDGLARTALRGEPLELFSRGELIRDALHVSDVVKAIAACVEQPAERGYVVMNLGCGRPIKAIEYAESLVSALASTSEVVPIDREASQENLYADIEHARQLIGFNPMTLEQSMSEYANELRA
jgi:UDP-glucose 4-epimerase